MIQDYTGTTVTDSDGNQIGSVERTYDDADGNARFVEIKIGTLLAKHRLVPVAGIAPDGDTLQVPYDKGTIEASPDASDAGDTLNGSLLDQAQAYYDGLSNDTSDEEANEEAEEGATPVSK